jgi:HK97 family phage portal protein
VSFTRRIATQLVERGGSLALEERGADPALPWGDSTPPPPFGAGSWNAPAGIVVNDDTALSTAVVFSCVSIVADAVATLPMYAYSDRGDGTHLRVDQQPAILFRPWAEITLQDWLTQVVTSLLMRGNAYLFVAERDWLGYPLQLIPVHPDNVSVKRNRNTGLREYRIGGQLVALDDIIHIPGISMPGSLIGLNPIQAIRFSVALAKATEQYGAAFFNNSAEAGGIISIDGDLEEDEAKRLAQSWMAAHQGIAKAHLPAVLTGGAKWTQIAISPDDAQFLQTRSFQKEELAMVYRVPLHMLNIQDRTSSWGTGIEQMEIGFVTNTLRPWLSRIEAAVSDVLPRSLMIRFDLKGRLRGDTLQRYQAYQIAISNGLLCPDEARAYEDLPPLPDGLGQHFYSSVQAVPIAHMLSQPVHDTAPPDDLLVP